MDTTIFKLHAKTELSLYPTILTSSLNIILINDIIMHMSKHSKKCTFYTLRFGCSFAAVNTIKPQLL